MPVIRILQLRRDLKANIPTLAVGEPFFATDTHELYIGSSGGNVKVDIQYTPATPGNWAGTPPSNLDSAVDRLAAAVRGLLGGPVP